MIGLIIFGTRGVTYKHEDGDFSCPVCQQKRSYHHRRVRRFFTLYFIPLVPLDLLGEYVECDFCSNTFNPDVKHFDPQGEAQAFAAEYQYAIKRVMVLMMMADGVIDDSEVRVIADIYQAITGSPLSEAGVRSEISDAEAADSNVAHYLGAMQGKLNRNGKSEVVRAAFMVAAADGVIHEDEKALLTQIGDALGLSRNDVRLMIDEHLATVPQLPAGS